jgi:hypothetical protein
MKLTAAISATAGATPSTRMAAGIDMHDPSAVYLIAKRLFYPSVAKRLGESSWLADGALC